MGSAELDPIATQIAALEAAVAANPKQGALDLVSALADATDELADAIAASPGLVEAFPKQKGGSTKVTLRREQAKIALASAQARAAKQQQHNRFSKMSPDERAGELESLATQDPVPGRAVAFVRKTYEEADTVLREALLARPVLAWLLGEGDEEAVDPTTRAIFASRDDLFSLHALIDINGRRYILTEVKDKDGRPDITLSTNADMTLQYANRRTVLLNGKEVTPFQAWLKSPSRRDYAGIVFDPSQESPPRFYNLYRGFQVQAIKGDCSLYLAHVRENICAGNKAHYQWLIGWMAHAVQRPWELPGTAVVMRGGEGIGKGKFVQWFGTLFEPHFLQVSSQRHLTGNFNAHMKSKLIVFADEAFFAGSKEARGSLYGMITERKRMIEPKGVDPYEVENFGRLLMASNSEWVVPGGGDARRFFVLEPSEKHKEDFAYFAAIDEQMKSGGLEALLYHLKFEVDISEFQPRNAPRTIALLDQKLKNLSAIERFWLDCLRKGAIGDRVRWMRSIPTHTVQVAYAESARPSDRERSTETELGIALRKMAPGLVHERGIPEGYTQRMYMYRVPSLADCRAEFAKQLQCDDVADLFGMNWDDPIEEE